MNKAIISTHRTFIYIIISCIYYYYNYVKKYFYRCKTRPIAWFGEVICLSEYLQLFIYSGKVLTRKGEVPPFHYWNVARKGQWEMVASIPLFFPIPSLLSTSVGKPINLQLWTRIQGLRIQSSPCFNFSRVLVQVISSSTTAFTRW